MSGIAKFACPQSFLLLMVQVTNRLHFPSAVAGKSHFRSDELVNKQFPDSH